MKEYTNSKPVFSDTIQITEMTDPAHADNINEAPKQLLQNTLVLKAELNNVKQQTGDGEDLFSEEKTYAAGDYCIYDNVLYIFTAVKEAGPWDPEAVNSTTVFGEIGALREIVMDLVDRMGGLSFRALSLEDYDKLPEKEENRIYFAVDDSSTTTLVDTPIQILPIQDSVDVDSQEDNEVSTVPNDTPIQLLPAPGDVAVVMPSEDDLESEENRGGIDDSVEKK